VERLAKENKILFILLFMYIISEQVGHIMTELRKNRKKNQLISYQSHIIKKFTGEIQNLKNNFAELVPSSLCVLRAFAREITG